MWKFCWALLLCAASDIAQTVEGNVINSRTGAGISGVKVAIVQAEKSLYSATTDTQGHFRIDDVMDGEYSAKFSSPDYWPDYWDGSKSPPQFRMTAGSGVRLEVQMAALPKLTGRVVDDRGKPVAVRMELLGPEILFAFGNTSDGRFAFLPPCPGLYTIAAVPFGKPKGAEPEPEKGHPRAWTRTFYPGVALYEAAAKIAVLPGMDLAAIELKLLAVRAHVVRGELLGPDGKPLAGVKVFIDGHGSAKISGGIEQ
jgi:Carboxypeptidase regulatory-like domain